LPRRATVSPRLAESAIGATIHDTALRSIDTSMRAPSPLVARR